MLNARSIEAGGSGIAARSYDSSLGCWATKVQPGEFYITVAHPEEAITTVLGSCVAACIRDPEAAIGGMNHFMLPEETPHGRGDWRDAVGLATRYGSYAMESLINGLLKLGARRERLEVKLFGGGQVLDVDMPVGQRNVEFARRWLLTEGLRVVAQDVGGKSPRRIIYFPATGMVKVKQLRPVESREVLSSERRYLGDVAARPLVGEIELFRD
ncbi:MAG: chemoreceptor glutamine deamidase CheD [Pseudomonadota bacterium]|jgi:chemotaxis protein CheD|nr:MAG: chemoreceptor glutamine deamidase CheD [Pseudomonadota bacterium]